MCFSAGASFGAGVVLSVIGTASLKLVKTPSEIPFAAIPIIFAVQQITEGILWLSLSAPGNAVIQSGAAYIFIFIAQVIWPCWVPFSILQIEPDIKRKNILVFLTGLGLMVSLYLLFCLLKYHVQGKIIGHHISYEQDYPAVLSKYGGMLYVISTIGPALFSTAKKMNYLGLSILLSYIISAIFYEEYVVSVWCFFASVISVLVFLVMYAINRTPKKYVY